MIHSGRCPRSLNSVMERSGLLDCFPASENRIQVVSGCFELTCGLGYSQVSFLRVQDCKWPCIHACAAMRSR
jgi:hypothetical protein